MSKPILGLIGGIGGGKSLVAAELARRGGRVIAGDLLGHEGLRQPEIKAEVVRRWGKDVLDENGEVNRRRLGEKIFADPAERGVLEALLFPYIERRFREETAKANDDPAVDFVVLDAAVMLEAGWNNVCDRLVYVHAPRAQRLRRLAEQRGWTAQEMAARESAQWPLTDKISRADFAVDNSGPPETVGWHVEELLRRWGILHRHGSRKIR